MNFQNKKPTKHKKIGSPDGNGGVSKRTPKIWVEAQLRDLDFGVYYLKLGFNKERSKGFVTVARSAIQAPGEVLLDKGAALAFQKTARRRKSITRRCGWAKDRSYVRPAFTVGPLTGTLSLHETAIDREIDSRKGNASEWRDGLREACLASSYNDKIVAGEAKLVQTRAAKIVCSDIIFASPRNEHALIRPGARWARWG